MAKFFGLVAEGLLKSALIMAVIILISDWVLRMPEEILFPMAVVWFFCAVGTGVLYMILIFYHIRTGPLKEFRND